MTSQYLSTLHVTDRTIQYDPEVHHFAMYLGGELVGWAATYADAEMTLDELVFAAFLAETPNPDRISAVRFAPPYAALTMAADLCPKCGAPCGDDPRWPCYVAGVLTEGCCQTCWEAECAAAWWDALPVMMAMVPAPAAGPDVPLDGPSEDEPGGEGGEPPPDDYHPAGLMCALAAHVARTYACLGGVQ